MDLVWFVECEWFGLLSCEWVWFGLLSMSGFGLLSGFGLVF